jgi:hypothetical protein
MLEAIFLFSLGITFILCAMLIFHFKNLISTLSDKYEQLFEVVRKIVEELKKTRNLVVELQQLSGGETNRKRPLEKVEEEDELEEEEEELAKGPTPLLFLSPDQSIPSIQQHEEPAEQEEEQTALCAAQQLQVVLQSMHPSDFSSPIEMERAVMQSMWESFSGGVGVTTVVEIVLDDADDDVMVHHGWVKQHHQVEELEDTAMQCDPSTDETSPKSDNNSICSNQAVCTDGEEAEENAVKSDDVSALSGSEEEDTPTDKSDDVSEEEGEDSATKSDDVSEAEGEAEGDVCTDEEVHIAVEDKHGDEEEDHEEEDEEEEDEGEQVPEQPLAFGKMNMRTLKALAKQHGYPLAIRGAKKQDLVTFLSTNL